MNPPGENGATLLLLTQPSSPHPPQINAPEDPESSLPRPHIIASTTYHIAIKGVFPGVCLMAAANTLFGVYQDWVQQNTGIHLDGGINEDDK